MDVQNRKHGCGKLCNSPEWGDNVYIFFTQHLIWRTESYSNWDSHAAFFTCDSIVKKRANTRRSRCKRPRTLTSTLILHCAWYLQSCAEQASWSGTRSMHRYLARADLPYKTNAEPERREQRGEGGQVGNAGWRAQEQHRWQARVAQIEMSQNNLTKQNGIESTTSSLS